jgi:Fe-S cluster biosynthesis and repair protein YggX
LKTVTCVRLKKELPGLDFPPYPGEFGQRILENVSKQAWEEWLNHQTMLINENRVNALNPEARKYLKTQCESFLFGEGADMPEGYIPPSQ